MYANLRAEMVRQGVTNQHIADLLGVRPATVSLKINGRYRFYYDECLKIKAEYFPQLSLEELFRKGDRQHTA